MDEYYYDLFSQPPDDDGEAGKGAHLDDGQRRGLPDNIDSLYPMLTERLATLSTRGKNAVTRLFERQRQSVKDIYRITHRLSFNAINLENVGTKTASEINAFFEEVCFWLEGFKDEAAVEKAVRKHSAPKLSEIGIPENRKEELETLGENLGHFPLFAVVAAYLDTLDTATLTIINGCIRIRNNQEIKPKRQVAKDLGLSAERVRQKTVTIIDSLSDYFESLRTKGYVHESPYPLDFLNISEINSSEGTDFTPNVIRWILSMTFEGISLVGNRYKALTSFYKDGIVLSYAPTRLRRLFDYESFKGRIASLVSERRTDSVRRSVSDFIKPFFKTTPDEESSAKVKASVNRILSADYGIPTFPDEDEMELAPNARKNIPLIIEDILRAAGRTMTLKELHTEFTRLYPDRPIGLEQLRANVNTNPNTVPVGRSSTYALAEWDTEETKGGTIRSLTMEYLQKQADTIAPFAKVVEYVRKYRPATDAANIYGNLCLESSGAFRFYYRDGERYIGTGDKTYPLEFFPSERSARESLSLSYYYPRLLSFIQTKGRFPFSSGVGEEEKSLCHFWARQVKRFESGDITPHSRLYYLDIIQKYGGLRIDKRSFDKAKARPAVIPGLFD